MDYVFACLLVAGCLVAWLSNLITLPGNWLIVGLAALYAALISPTSPVAMGWQTVFILLGIALIGEVLEFATGAVGASRAGGSRRGALLAIIGSIVGGIVGLGLGLPIPLVGPVIGAVLCAGLGAFLGAMLGEIWRGRDLDSSWRVGEAAFWGRLAGSLAKLLAGLAMILGLIAAIIF